MCTARSKRQHPHLMACLPLILAFLSLLAFSDDALIGVWRWQNPRPQGNPLYGIKFSDTRRGIAVGRDGAILHSEDGGQHWESARSPVNTPLYGLAVKDRKAWAVGARGEI